MIGTSSGKTIMATNKVLGRSTAGTGAIEEISIGSNLTLSGGTLSASGGVTGVAASATDILSVSGSDIAADDPGADRLVFWDDSDNKLTYLTAGSGLTITGTTITSSGGIGGSTGSVDNAILRADSTGGATLQSSDINIDDATTSTQNNVAITNQHSGQTNSALVLTPKGTGAFILGPKPDGTATGGNARGARAVDLQLERGGAIEVASGVNSFTVGHRCRSSGNGSSALGSLTVASGANSFCVGGDYSLSSTASATNSVAFGFTTLSDRAGMHAHAHGRFSANGDAQRARFVLRNKTTTNAAVELFLDGSSTRLTIPSGKVFAFTINISGVKSDGSAVAHYLRQYALKNVAGTTSQVYAPVTIGTDNAAGTSIALSANDTNDALKVEVTGITSETWRWVASVDAVEIAYGT